MAIEIDFRCKFKCLISSPDVKQTMKYLEDNDFMADLFARAIQNCDELDVELVGSESMPTMWFKLADPED
jgi:hypothetical protein